MQSIIMCFLNLMAWKAGWAHRTGENGKKKEDNDKIKKSVQTSSACDITKPVAVELRCHATALILFVYFL